MTEPFRPPTPRATPARRRPLLIAAAVAIAWSTRAAAQEPDAGQAAARAPDADAVLVEQPTSPVTIDGATVFRVRGVSAYPAERRAAEISQRIAAVAADRTIPPESLVVREAPEGSYVVARNHRLFAVLDADAELEGVSRQVLAEAYRDRTAEAVQGYRRDREVAAVERAGGRALLATAAFLLFLWLGRRGERAVRARIEARYRARVKDVNLQTIEIVRGEQVWRILQRAASILVTVLVVVATYFFVKYVLLLFPWTRAAGYSFTGMLLRPIAALGAGFVRSIPDLVFLVVIAIVTRWALRLVHLVALGVHDGTIVLPGFDPEWAKPTERLVRLAVVAFAIVISYPYIPGSDSRAFEGIGLLLGLMFSLGSPSVIGNAVAGQSLAFRRAFRVGDRVRIGDHMGDVTDIQLLTTYLRTPKNEVVVIPNSMILNSEVVNYSTLATAAGLLLHTNVTIGYETPWRQVEAMLIEAARRTPGLRQDPPPFVLQKALGTFAVDYEINVACETPRLMMRLYAALHRNILDVFNEFGVQIMTPAYEGDPERRKVVPPEEWFPSPASKPDGADPLIQLPPARPATSAAAPTS
jgi:small-conductance mechanosensitive channel